MSILAGQVDRLATICLLKNLQPGWMMIDQAVRQVGHQRFPTGVSLGVDFDYAQRRIHLYYTVTLVHIHTSSHHFLSAVARILRSMLSPRPTSLVCDQE